MATNSESIRMTVSLPDEKAGQEMLRYLATVDEGDVEFTVHCVTQDERRPCTISVDEITPKQWEAAKLAVESGYYHDPRETDLESLADELDVTKSAISQRLGNLERKLMVNLVDACE